MKKRPTMKSIGEAANVSAFTVSRALSDGDGVSPSTREHVRAIASELGYIPNQLARGLRGGSSRAIGILAANTINPYYATLITSIERVLRERGYHGIVMDAVLDGEYRLDREDDFIQDLLQHQVAAVVLAYSISSANVAKLRDHGVELVFVDSQPPVGYEDMPSVNPENYAASRELGEHLAGHGYAGPWAFVGLQHSFSARKHREAGFTDAAHAAGVEVEVIEGQNDAEASYEAVHQYLEEARTTGRPAPRAMFASNELLLQGSLRALRDHGLRVPSDVAVVAYDNFAWASLVEPPVTVMDQKVAEIGAMAAATLLAQIDSEDAPSGERIQITPDLIVRRSCGCTDTT